MMLGSGAAAGRAVVAASSLRESVPVMLGSGATAACGAVMAASSRLAGLGKTAGGGVVIRFCYESGLDSVYKG
jgi:hypothetical protein